MHAGKIFVHPPQKVLDRIIYKISDYQMRASVKNDFEHLRLDLNEMLILTFLAKKYIRKFGNDWKSITKFIEMNPIFSNTHITQEIVQEVYQVVTKYDNQDSLAEIDLWDKKILPFDHYGCYSYAEFDEKLYGQAKPQPSTLVEEESRETDDDLPAFDFERYQEMIEEPPEEPELPQLELLEEEYRAYGLPVFEKILKAGEHSFVIDREEKFAKIERVLGKFRESESKVDYACEEREKRESVARVLEELLAMKGGEIKPAYPFRKKKSNSQPMQTSTNATTSWSRSCRPSGTRTSTRPTSRPARNPTSPTSPSRPSRRNRPPRSQPPRPPQSRPNNPNRPTPSTHSFTQE